MPYGTGSFEAQLAGTNANHNTTTQLVEELHTFVSIRNNFLLFHHHPFFDYFRVPHLCRPPRAICPPMAWPMGMLIHVAFIHNIPPLALSSQREVP